LSSLINILRLVQDYGYIFTCYVDFIFLFINITPVLVLETVYV